MRAKTRRMRVRSARRGSSYRAIREMNAMTQGLGGSSAVMRSPPQVGYTRLQVRTLSEQLNGYHAHVERTRKTVHRHGKDTGRGEHLALMADLFGMLSDPSRLKILMQLQDHEDVCVSDLAEWTEVSESAVSHALRLLRAHGIVDARREGRWIYYSMVDEHVRVLLEATVEHLERDHG
jgi:ArsR family transcriptional regulator, lead/cadmium/zinc/bismuth-responsive transcriptional repressor